VRIDAGASGTAVRSDMRHFGSAPVPETVPDMVRKGSPVRVRQQGPSAREAQLERELEQVTSALGEAHVELRLLKRGGMDFASRSWR
jgi:hypothetical protein